MDMERQKPQWEEEEEEDAVTQLHRRRENKSSLQPPVYGEANGGNVHAEADEPEQSKEINYHNHAGEHNGDEAVSFNSNNSVYFDNNKGNEPADGVSGTEYTVSLSPVLEKSSKDEELHIMTKELDIQRVISAEINHHRQKDSGDEVLPCSSPSPAEVLGEGKSTSLEDLDSKTGIDISVGLIEENDEEFDVERVIEKQTTHDLYCPNCNSCITRRVILRRKKRRVRNIRYKSKHDKSEIHTASDGNSANATNDQLDDTPNIRSNDSISPGADDENLDRWPCIFKCLSCFWLFIPKANIGPGHSEVDGIRVLTKDAYMKPQQGGLEVLNSETSYEKPQLGIDQETNVSMRNETLADHNGLDLSIHAASSQTESSISLGLANTARIKLQETQNGALTSSAEAQIPSNGISSDSGVKLDNAMAENNAANIGPGHSEVDGIRVLTKNAYMKPQQGGLEALNSATSYEKPQLGIDQETNVPMRNETLVDHNGLDLSIHAASSQTEASTSLGLANTARIKLQETQNGALTSSAEEQLPSHGISSDSGVKLDNAMVENTAGNDVRVIIETPPAQPDVEESEAHQWDILKSIVYGGLIESITSLGVVSSAAATGAGTLNILVLGLANLVGGLFIIFNNLRELKDDRSGETSTEMNKQEDRYQQQLGRRENFSLHASIVVLSFLTFGLMPPVIYGFSFCESDNRDMKIVAVACSSLACVILLALGKAHIQKAPRSYFTTVLHYVIIAITTSGLSYVVGDLLKKLFEKLNLFEPASDVITPFLEASSMKSGWASY
ncbi:Membrane protein of ER body-like protein [Melia azedarach]|uniref:Membrane protein of ER body-like protein n=1 Tax=Melia azedarach TaxID=155640 RepID=A0ACC1YUS2_MELAZ|nr:Membrane protein of ER body-like protein [Melia azedarach]